MAGFNLLSLKESRASFIPHFRVVSCLVGEILLAYYGGILFYQRFSFVVFPFKKVLKYDSVVQTRGVQFPSDPIVFVWIFDRKGVLQSVRIGR